MKIHPEGHIETHWSSLSVESLNARLDANKDKFLPENLEIVKRFIYDARIGKTIIGREKKKIGLKRLAKYLQDLKKLDAYFKKPFDQINEKEMERFIMDLEDGILKTKTGLPYAKETQSVIKKMLKKFYKWLMGNNEIVPSLVRWIDTSIELKEYHALKKEQVENIVNLMTSNTSKNLVRNRALVMFLFDSGARADELLNIRISHLSLENENYKARIEFSKTRKRTVTLPYTKAFLDTWLDVHPMRDQPMAQLFPMNYDQLRMVIQRAGQVIGVKLTPHGLRHSSATYWCKHLKQYELCYRFGWSMSSKMPQRYIDREGLEQENVSKIVRAGQVEKLEYENSMLSRRLATIEDTMNKLMGEDVEEARKILKKAKEMVEMKAEHL
jgi:integrase